MSYHYFYNSFRRYISPHRDGLLSHGDTLTPSDLTGQVCVYQDYTMVFILAIMPLHFLSLYSI